MVARRRYPPGPPRRSVQHPRELQKIADAFGGMLIWGCLPGSPCDRAGVVYGDIVLEVNGVPTGSIAAYEEAKARDAEVFHVRFLRQGKTHDVRVPLA
jgi:S1-C subfamily serine protease